MRWESPGRAPFTFDADGGFGTGRGEHLGERLRAVGASPSQDAAPDQIGLPAAVRRWFADGRIIIEVASATTVGGVARDVVVVDSPCDPAALAADLTRAGRRRITPRPYARAV